MQAASLFDGFSFDLFPPFENGLTAPEVDVGRRQVVQALVVSTVVVQQGLRTPTEPSFENCCTHGIRGLVFGSAFTRRSRGRLALFFAAA